MVNIICMNVIDLLLYRIQDLTRKMDEAIDEGNPMPYNCKNLLNFNIFLYEKVARKKYDVKLLRGIDDGLETKKGNDRDREAKN